MRVLLQTLDHGAQYRFAQSVLLDIKSKYQDVKIVELKSPNTKKSFVQRFQHYRKRKKLKSLLLNALGRLFNKPARAAFSKKTGLIDRILEKHFTPPNEEFIERVDDLNAVQSIIAQWEPDVVLVIGAPYLPKTYFIDGIIYINLHIGKIPQYRGLKCIEWALINKDISSVGYTVHELTSRLDFGGIYRFQKVNIEGKTLSEIYAECYTQGIPDAITVALDSSREIITQPDGQGRIYYSVEFNSFAIRKVLKTIEI